MQPGGNGRPLISNGSGHSPPRKKKSAVIALRSSKDHFLSILNSKVVILFVAGCVIFTILMDLYFLWPRDASKDILLNKAPTQKTGVVTSVDPSAKHQHYQQQQQRQFANIPPMKKQNRNFTKHHENSEYGREPILKVFDEAGIPPLNDSMIALLPTWEQVVQVVGPHPVVGGLDTCETFRQNVPAVERMLGSAGMFNTGTNLVTHLLKGNCRVPERVEKYGVDASKEAHGYVLCSYFLLFILFACVCSLPPTLPIVKALSSWSYCLLRASTIFFFSMRWQVPWGKHSPAKYKELHSTQKAKAINKEWIMPVVTIRHPYSWMHSMCKNVSTSAAAEFCLKYSARGPSYLLLYLYTNLTLLAITFPNITTNTTNHSTHTANNA